MYTKEKEEVKWEGFIFTHTHTYRGICMSAQYNVVLNSILPSLLNGIVGYGAPAPFCGAVD